MESTYSLTSSLNRHGREEKLIEGVVGLSFVFLRLSKTVLVLFFFSMKRTAPADVAI